MSASNVVPKNLMLASPMMPLHTMTPICPSMIPITNMIAPPIAPIAEIALITDLPVITFFILYTLALVSFDGYILSGEI